MAKRASKNVWLISDGKQCAMFNANIGGFAMPLPLILASRQDARQVMKTFPYLADKYSIRKAANQIVSL